MGVICTEGAVGLAAVECRFKLQKGGALCVQNMSTTTRRHVAPKMYPHVKPTDIDTLATRKSSCTISCFLLFLPCSIHLY